MEPHFSRKLAINAGEVRMPQRCQKQHVFPRCRRESGGDLLRMAIGDTIDGWTVKDIQADGVIFDRDGETTEVKLRDLKPGQSRKASRPTKKPPRKRRRTRSRRSEPKATTPAAKSTSPRSRANRER